jgi:hypothetical protein
MRVGGRSIFAGMGSRGLYLELTGLAAARMDVLAFRVVMIPAFAIETVCCSCKIKLSDQFTAFVAHLSFDYHNLVQNTSGSIAHLVKFVDTADASV